MSSSTDWLSSEAGARRATSGALVAVIVFSAAGCTVNRSGIFVDEASGAASGGGIMWPNGGTGGEVGVPTEASGGSGSGSGGTGLGGPGTGSGGTPVTGTGGQSTSGSGGRVVSTGGKSGDGGGGGSGGAPGTGGGAGPGSGGASGGGGGGSAPSSCNERTCANGCCRGDECVTGNNVNACGLGGGACQTCAACLRCSNKGACELDMSSRWVLSAVSASLEPLRPDGTEWDSARQRFGGPAPDPFVQLDMPKGTPVGWTKTIVDSVEPRWDSPVTESKPMTFRARDLLAGGQPFYIWVGDEDNLDASGDQSLSEEMCNYVGPFELGAFLSGGLTLKDSNSCKSLVLALTCSP